jgi:hypothetical protein
LFFPGLLFWGAVSFLLIESPGMRFGKWLIDRGRAFPEVTTVDAPFRVGLEIATTTPRCRQRQKLFTVASVVSPRVMW